MCCSLYTIHSFLGVASPSRKTMSRLMCSKYADRPVPVHKKDNIKPESKLATHHGHTAPLLEIFYHSVFVVSKEISLDVNIFFSLLCCTLPHRRANLLIIFIYAFNIPFLTTTTASSAYIFFLIIIHSSTLALTHIIPDT